MNKPNYKLLLKETIDTLSEADHWLARSYKKCKEIGIKKQFTEEEFDAFENLTSRFARTSDIIVQKAYKTIDKLEFEYSGTLIDILNRSHKRGLFDSIEEIRIIRELRNEIAHEYTKKDLTHLFSEILKLTPILFKLITSIKKYSEGKT
ncbi:hypothetical protein ACFL96_14750 [Thermoproteota archaeon]